MNPSKDPCCPDPESCCPPSSRSSSDSSRSQTSSSTEEVRDAVRSGYAEVVSRFEAASKLGSPPPATGNACCGTPTASGLAEALGYERSDLEALPEGANMGLSCGNPHAIAQLREGEVVLDLGSGGGLDCFLAGPRVGAKGRVIGVDMTAEMISKARRNRIEYLTRSGLDNVEFRLGEIEHLPVADASIDVVLSNCVINLSPDKAQTWREVYRVLKPGGRLAISDMALLKDLPEHVRDDVQALVGCVAGASTVDETDRLLKMAGFEQIDLVPRGGHVSAMVGSDNSTCCQTELTLPAGFQADEYVTSLDIRARKPLAS